MFLNKVQIIGNLTRDPELKALPSGQQVCTFSVATNETFTKDGQKQERAEFHNVVVWGKTAENVARYMKKGSQIFIEGKLQTRKWEKDGVTHYRTEIMALPFGVQFGSKPRGESAPAKDDFDDFEQSNARAAGEEVEYPEAEINPEDIPF